MQEEVNRLKRAVLSSAEERKEDILRRALTEKETALFEFRQALTEKEAAKYKEAANRYVALTNEKIATYKMDAHRALLIRREEIAESLKKEVEEELRRYVKTPEYAAHFTERIQEVAERFAGETLFLEVCRKEDAEAAQSVAEVRLAEEDFLGGFRLGIPNRRMVIDESLHSRLEDAFREFHEIRIESEEEKA